MIKKKITAHILNETKHNLYINPKVVNININFVVNKVEKF